VLDAQDDAPLPFLAVIKELGMDVLSGGAPLFVPLCKASLLADIATHCHLPPNKIIFLLDQQIPPEEAFLTRIRDLSEAGFSFAIENVPDFEFMDAVIQLCDYVFVSFGAKDAASLDLYARLSSRYNDHIFIASDVNDNENFEVLQKRGLGFFEGSFYALPLANNRGKVSPIKVNRMQILSAMQKPDFNMDDIIKIVSRDPSMTISLLKLVNSPYMGIRQEIKSIPQAVALLGEKELRKWVMTVVVSLLADDKPSQLVRLGLFRAKFSESIAKLFGLSMLSNTLFLMGLFSILDAALDVPMAEALEKINLTDDAKDALLQQKGRLAPVMEFVLCYEKADWDGVRSIAKDNKMNIEEIFASYMEAALWYGSILKG